MQLRNYSKGIVFLPLVLILSLLILLVGLAILSGGFIETSTSSSDKELKEVLFVAEAGIQDAIEKIARNKDFTSAGYSLSVGNGSTNVTVSGTTAKTILSQATLKNKTKKIQVTVDVDTNGKLTQTSWQEIE